MLLLTISVRVHRQEERLREKRKVAYMKDIVSPDCTFFSKVHVKLYNSQQKCWIMFRQVYLRTSII